MRVAQVVEGARCVAGGEGEGAEGGSLPPAATSPTFEYILESIGVGADQRLQTLRVQRGVPSLIKLHATLRTLQPALLPERLPIDGVAPDAVRLEGFLRVVLAAFDDELPEALRRFLGVHLEAEGEGEDAGEDDGVDEGEGEGTECELERGG